VRCVHSVQASDALNNLIDQATQQISNAANNAANSLPGGSSSTPAADAGAPATRRMLRDNVHDVINTTAPQLLAYLLQDHTL
jgi:hypothetical protein